MVVDRDEGDQPFSQTTNKPSSVTTLRTERGDRGGHSQAEKTPWRKAPPVLPSAVLEEKREAIPKPGGLGLVSSLCIAIFAVVIIALFVYIASQTGLLLTVWRRLH